MPLVLRSHCIYIFKLTHFLKEKLQEHVDTDNIFYDLVVESERFQQICNIIVAYSKSLCNDLLLIMNKYMLYIFYTYTSMQSI